MTAILPADHDLDERLNAISARLMQRYRLHVADFVPRRRYAADGTVIVETEETVEETETEESTEETESTETEDSQETEETQEEEEPKEDTEDGTDH